MVNAKTEAKQRPVTLPMLAAGCHAIPISLPSMEKTEKSNWGRAMQSSRPINNCIFTAPKPLNLTESSITNATMEGSHKSRCAHHAAPRIRAREMYKSGKMNSKVIMRRAMIIRGTLWFEPAKV